MRRYGRQGQARGSRDGRARLESRWRLAVLNVGLTAWVLLMPLLLAGCGSSDANSEPAAVAPNLPRSEPPTTPIDVFQSSAPTAPATLAPVAVGGGDTEVLASDVVRLQGRVDTRIDLSFTSVSDDDLARLELPDTVSAINLSGTKITDRGIQHLSRARNLQELILIDTQVTAGILESLKQMPHLTDVRLDNTNVPVAAQLEMVRYLAPRVQARTQRQVQAAQQRK